MPKNTARKFTYEIKLLVMVTEDDVDMPSTNIWTFAEAVGKAAHALMPDSVVIVDDAALVGNERETDEEISESLLDDRFDHLPADERCPVCGQPDNCGDCNHERIPDDLAEGLR